VPTADGWFDLSVGIHKASTGRHGFEDIDDRIGDGGNEIRVGLDGKRAALNACMRVRRVTSDRAVPRTDQLLLNDRMGGDVQIGMASRRQRR
jgi:hypothetical protein